VAWAALSNGDQRQSGWREGAEVFPREKWPIARRPRPTDRYWISNVPADTEPENLARLARTRWMLELDHKRLKGENAARLNASASPPAARHGTTKTGGDSTSRSVRGRTY
jgi:hypothetical protein